MVGAVSLLSMLIICTGMVGCQRRHVLQEAMERVKSYPSHRSSSPSWGGERQFEIIGTGGLPIQNQRYSSQGERSTLRLTPRPGPVRRKKNVNSKPGPGNIDRYNPILIDSEQTISQIFEEKKTKLLLIVLQRVLTKLCSTAVCHQTVVELHLTNSAALLHCTAEHTRAETGFGWN